MWEGGGGEEGCGGFGGTVREVVDCWKDGFGYGL